MSTATPTTPSTRGSGSIRDGPSRASAFIQAVPRSVSLGGDGARGRRSVPREVGRAVRHGRRRGAGVRDSRRRLRARRARRGDRRRRDRLPGRARRHPRPQPTPSGGRPGSRARTAATMPKATWIWSGAWTLTSGSTGEWLALVPGPQSVAEPRHWLAGRLAVVTGASRGIGAATAEAMAAAGAHVVLAARDREALDGVAARIRDARRRGHAGADGRERGRRRRAPVRRRSRGSGALAALVCAAGVLTSAPFAETTPEIVGARRSGST